MARPLCISFVILLLLSSLQFVASQTECDGESLCATGCCSKWGHCGTGKEFCGEGCQSTCDYKLGCDENNPCEDGTCCSKFGFCGLGPDYCADETCVANCDAKSYCDPGYGSEWSEIGECPLNVCCSKWGFCGVTKEFCGEKEVKRPSCDAQSFSTQRVIGYYEGWATGRRCDVFGPEDIPGGVYTHLNFAFASIDPATYKIVPAAQGDEALYRRLTGLKRIDPQLKVFIAIGGWAFNDPGPTMMTFSNIAQSEANQRTFISSLISFMNTYDFDGVDIDWEYPEAPDRHGRPEDYKNLPIFMMNLKMALNGNGARNGLSMTLPASYWYMRHFNVQQLEKHVDWFNIMSYDLHGTWDDPDSWLKNHLNSHTNLTEIADAMDLLWRNHIDPSKVVMGLAFYSRTFTASDPNCMEKGCFFDSGGQPGTCSNTVGVLTDAEIVALMKLNGGSPELDQAAAVKIYKTGNEWITYDDEDTFRLKIEYARSQCMGGVMVWAVSQDTLDGRFSRALQSVTGYHSKGVYTVQTKGGIFVDYPSGESNVEQCYWSNCDEECAAFWIPVLRRDRWRHGDLERMLDDTECLPGQFSRRFCCPPGPMPSCGWYSVNAGNCDPECPSGSFEIASFDGACYNGLSQLACCKLTEEGDDDGPEIESMKIWDKCRWAGKEPNCGVLPFDEDFACSDVPGDRTDTLVLALAGSGSTECYSSKFLYKADVPQAYCCSEPTDMRRWENCQWFGDNEMALRGGSGYCEAKCPYGYSKVALDNDPNVCEVGSRAWCCEGFVASDSSVDEAYIDHAKELLRGYTQYPSCSVESVLSIPWHLPVLGGDQVQKRFEGQPSGAVAKQFAMFIFFHQPKDLISVGRYDAWDSTVAEEWPMLTASNVHDIFTSNKLVKEITMAYPDQTADSLVCQPAAWEESISVNGTKQPCPCDPTLLDEVDPLPNHQIDDDTSTTRGEDALSSEVDKRTGQPRAYPVRFADGSMITVRSAPYINGANGDNLADANGDDARYYLLINNATCTAELRDDAPASEIMESEHPIELQTVPRFMEFVADGEAPPGNQRSGDSRLNQPMLNPNGAQGSNIMFQYFARSFNRWEQEFGPSSSPVDSLFDLLGSVTNPFSMINTQRRLNNIKQSLWRMYNPIADNRWRQYFGEPTERSFSLAASEIHHVFGVFRYMNNDAVQGLMGEINENIIDLMQMFDRLHAEQYAIDNPGHTSQADSFAEQWRDYMNLQMQRVVLYAREWIRLKLDELGRTWQAEYARMLGQFQSRAPSTPFQGGPTAQDIQALRDRMDLIHRLKDEVAQFVHFPAEFF